MRRPSPDRAGAAGFTLIETLVALAIVGMAMTAIADVLGTGLLSHRTSNAAQTALSIAESEIATAGAAAPLAPNTSEGIAGGSYHWVLTVSPFDDPAKNPAASLAELPTAWRLYRIAVTVGWRDGLHQRQIALDTLRLAPAAPL